VPQHLKENTSRDFKKILKKKKIIESGRKERVYSLKDSKRTKQHGETSFQSREQINQIQLMARTNYAILPGNKARLASLRGSASLEWLVVRPVIHRKK
jgi:hypothetical protein